MTSSSKDRGSGKDDCQIHVDKEGESCVIKIESVGQEKMLRELLGRLSGLKGEVDQLLAGQQKQQQPKEMLDAIQGMTAKLKPLEDQLQKVNKHVGDDHAELSKMHGDVNKKFDEIKQDLNGLKEHQKASQSIKEAIEKILQKLDNLDKAQKNSQEDAKARDEGQKRLSADLQSLKQQPTSKIDLQPILDAVQALHNSFDKEKSKPDVLARKLDALDQKLKDSHPEHMAAMKDIQTKIDPLHKATPHTSETLTKINDRIKAMHADTAKPHPDVMKKLDDIATGLKAQQTNVMEPMKQLLHDKLEPLFDQQKSRQQAKKEAEEKLGSTEKIDATDSNSPNRVPLCINGMIPVSSEFCDPHVLAALAGDIAKKLTDIQAKLASTPSSDEMKRKQDDLLGKLNEIVAKQQAPLVEEIKRLTPIVDKLKQQQQKEPDVLNREMEKTLQPLTQKLNELIEKQPKQNEELRRRLDAQPDVGKEITTRTQPLQQAVDHLSKQQQPLMDAIRTLPDKVAAPLAKKLDDLRQSQDKSDFVKELSVKLDPLAQSIRAIKDGLDQQTRNVTQVKDRDSQMLADIDKKLNQTLSDTQKRPDVSKEIEKGLQPFSQMIKQLKDSFDNQQRNANEKLNQALSAAQQQPDATKEYAARLEPLAQAVKTLKDDVGKSQNDVVKKLDDLGQRLFKSTETSPKTADIVGPILGKLNDVTPAMKKLSDDLTAMKIFVEKQPRPPTMEDIKARDRDLLARMDEISQKQKPPVQATSKDSVDDQIRQVNNKIDQLQAIFAKGNDDSNGIKKRLDDLSQKTAGPTPELINALRQLEDQMGKQNKVFHDQLGHLSNSLPAMNDLPKQLGALKNAVDKLNPSDVSSQKSAGDPVRAMKEVNERLKGLEEAIKRLPDDVSSRAKRSMQEDDGAMANLRQVPFSQSAPQDASSLTGTSDGQMANLITNLLALETAIQSSQRPPCDDIRHYLKRVGQSQLVQSDRDLQGLVQRVENLCSNNNNSKNDNPNSSNASRSPSSTLDPRNGAGSNPMNRDGNSRRDAAGGQSSNTDTSNNHNSGGAGSKKLVLPRGHLTKSRYITTTSEQTIRDHWPKLPQRAGPIIDAIVTQPLEFDDGAAVDRLVKQYDLQEYASATQSAIGKSNKDYDKMTYMMDSIVFDQMTMIGGREALIRPWDPSLLNRASSKGSYPYSSGNGRLIERFKVNKEIALWMVETDEIKAYNPSEFMPNIPRLTEKYDQIQHPQYNEIRQKKREDETRWNERYAFTKDNRTVLFVNDLRSYFMDYDTKRKYQVHDGVPINPVCRTGIAGRGDLPFWGPNHCVVVVLLRNLNDPEVVLMRHHGNALILPKGFYGHQARYDNMTKIIQDPVSGQILPPQLLDYWWSQVIKLNETNSASMNLRRVLNDRELKDEFAEIFSQKGCNKSVFDNGYVDHPLNTDHAWVESSVWKVQFKDWRVPEMKSARYAVADELKHGSAIPFVWMKLTDAMLVVPPFDRGILVDVLATGMPL